LRLKFWSRCLLAATILIGCGPTISQEQQLKARSGLDLAVAQIPEMEGFTNLKVVYQEFYDSEHGNGKVCYYARAFFVIGSSFSKTEAPLAYAQRFQSLGLGWIAREDPFEPTVMFRGDNEVAIVTSNKPDYVVHDAVDYTRMEKIYVSIIFLRLEYQLPSRAEC